MDNILESFVFHEKEQFLMCYPQGYHKTDKLVSRMGTVEVAAWGCAAAIDTQAKTCSLAAQCTIETVGSRRFRRPVALSPELQPD